MVYNTRDCWLSGLRPLSGIEHRTTHKVQKLSNYKNFYTILTCIYKSFLCVVPLFVFSLRERTYLQCVIEGVN
jgi:hypothetical protein